MYFVAGLPALGDCLAYCFVALLRVLLFCNSVALVFLFLILFLLWF